MQTDVDGPAPLTRGRCARASHPRWKTCSSVCSPSPRTGARAIHNAVAAELAALVPPHRAHGRGPAQVPAAADGGRHRGALVDAGAAEPARAPPGGVVSAWPSRASRAVGAPHSARASRERRAAGPAAGVSVVASARVGASARPHTLFAVAALAGHAGPAPAIEREGLGDRGGGCRAARGGRGGGILLLRRRDPRSIARARPGRQAQVAMKRGAGLGGLASLALACGGAEPPAPAVPATPASASSEASVAWPSPPRYLVVSPSWIERTGDGLDRVVDNGGRLEVRGAEIVAMGPGEIEVDGGARAPDWARGSAARYVFWKGRQLWGSETFMGALRPLGALRGEPSAAFDWLDGTGIVLPGGARVVPALARDGASSGRTGAAGAPPRRRGGRAAGASPSPRSGTRCSRSTAAPPTRDVSADLGAFLRVLGARRGDDIAAVPPGGPDAPRDGVGRCDRRRRPPGAPARGGAAAERAGRRSRSATSVRPIESAAARRAAARRRRRRHRGARVRGPARSGSDPAMAPSVAPLDAGLRDAECTPVRVASAGAGEILLACAAPDRAVVTSTSTARRAPSARSTSRRGPPELDRFVRLHRRRRPRLPRRPATAASRPHVPEPLTLPSGEPYNASHRRTPVFLRARRARRVGRAPPGPAGRRRRHRLDPAGRHGGAVGAPGAARGSSSQRARARLRARRPSASCGSRGASLRCRSLRTTSTPASTRCSISRPRAGSTTPSRGWLNAHRGSATGVISVTIDAGGHAPAPRRAPPRAQQDRPRAGARAHGHRGRQALGDGRRRAALGGRSRAPPGAGLDARADARLARARPPCRVPRGATSVRLEAGRGRMSRRARLLRAGGGLAEPLPGDGAPRPLERCGGPAPPLVRLSCAVAGARPRGPAVISESAGLRLQPWLQQAAARPRSPGSARSASRPMPWNEPGRLATSGDAEVAFLAPLDLAAKQCDPPGAPCRARSSRFARERTRVSAISARRLPARRGRPRGLETFATSAYFDQCYA